MIPLHIVPHYAARRCPKSHDGGIGRVLMWRDGTTTLYARGAVISAGPRYRCPKCRRLVYTEVYGG